jgi:maleate cis-trans isomerase
MTTVGLLYPGYGAEDDFPALERRLAAAGVDVSLPLVHTSVGEDAHRVDALLDLGGHQRLVEGAHTLQAGRGDGHRLDSLMWACTSGSFVFGWGGAHQQVAQLTEATGLPTSSTSLAFVSACRAIGATRVSIAASYPDDVAQHFRTFLQHAGIEVSAMGSQDIFTAAEVGTLDHEQVVAMVSRVDRDDAHAVLVPDTAMHSLGWLPDLEEAAGMPVLTANQVTVYEGLRLAGAVPSLPDLGTLFARESAGAR